MRTSNRVAPFLLLALAITAALFAVLRNDARRPPAKFKLEPRDAPPPQQPYPADQSATLDQVVPEPLEGPRGTTIRVVERDSQRALPGISLFLETSEDWDELGMTDSAGVLELALPSIPISLVARSPQYFAE